MRFTLFAPIPLAFNLNLAFGMATFPLRSIFRLLFNSFDNILCSQCFSAVAMTAVCWKLLFSSHIHSSSHYSARPTNVAHSTEDRQFMCSANANCTFCMWHNARNEMIFYVQKLSFFIAAIYFNDAMANNTDSAPTAMERKTSTHTLYARLLAHTVPTKYAWLMNETFGHKWNEKFTPRTPELAMWKMASTDFNK